MKCNVCGYEISDGSKFCPFCGSTVGLSGGGSDPISETAAVPENNFGNAGNAEPFQQAYQQQTYQPQDQYGSFGGVQQTGGDPEWRSKLSGISLPKAAAAVAAVIIVIAGASAIGRAVKIHNCGKPFKNLEEGFEDCDIYRMLDAFPEDVSDLITDEIGDDEIEDAEEEIEEGMAPALEEMNFGDKIEITHKIMNCEKLSSDSLDRLNELYEDADLDVEIKKCYSVDVRFTVEGDNGNESYVTGNFSVGKVDGDWKLVDFNTLISDYSQYDPLDTVFEYLAEAIADLKSGDSRSYLDDYYDDFDDYDDYYDDYDY